ncbi:oxidoreductase alpha (molybdopterin) subunit [Aeromicrobium marinum DSM 15272]|uniref:Oxidoreductase alpha (Molybdopterin) subunit n=1 Tax=Aeromicrobium marinum DSM 15272 TaxID=585531 RepID=E2SDA7_9ACTN|nr:FdhF/YdeP family oxidoreductase [Aeromicrobium marinum]EFQ82484.1 oxidoreductase alpha (molybdopterin) subunit [Aeromicrobium marinum DSM 15272]
MADETDRQVENIDESRLEVGRPKKRAAGVPAVRHSLQMSVQQMGVKRTALTLLKVNQTDGFDCPGCAWPEHDQRHTAEFCENGAKAVAEEATRRRVTPEFFAEHSLQDLREWDDFALGQQGRLTHPMLLEAGDTHYRPVTWERAFDVVAEELAALDTPDAATFYTSGRTSNEAAFLYQLFVRGFGTNNLPDCSNMCHESSGSALGDTIGIGKGSVSLEDVEQADVIVIAGQNPGTNHPRMLTSLEKAKAAGATIVAVNPLREAGLLNFANPQKARGVVGRGTDLADEFLQVRLGGDQALFQALAAILVEIDTASPGAALDHEFIAAHTDGLDDFLAGLATLDWATVHEATGLAEADIRRVAGILAGSRRTVICWAMGLTQHPHAVATLRDAVNLLLLQGNIGRPGAGVCPVRGHSNVQGDRTMGIWEKMPEEFLDAIDDEFGFRSPREHGLDTVDSIRAMRRGDVRVFMGLGGNFVRATPDSAATEEALASLDLTVQVSTKLNRSHVVTGRRALILPTLGRTEVDEQATGPQRVSVEDSMSAVHASVGSLEPASPHLRSEVAIIAGIAERVLAGRTDAPRVDWSALRGDYRRIRESIARVVPGFEDVERRLDRPGGFVLPHPPRDERRFETSTGRAHFTRNEVTYPVVPPGRLLLQTLRSHDQFNTTIYGRDDRYRGITGGRRVVFVHADDLAAQGLVDGDHVDLVSEFADGVERRAERFRAVAYDTPRGCAAAYYPETNVLVPLDAVAKDSNTPASKSVVIRLEPVT